jgi:hypothetical protein
LVDEVLEGRDDWLKYIWDKRPVLKNTGKYGDWLIRRFLDLPRGFRLIKEWVEKLIIGDELTLEERDLLIKAFINREVILVFNWTYYGIIWPEVAPP